VISPFSAHQKAHHFLELLSTYLRSIAQSNITIRVHTAATAQGCLFWQGQFCNPSPFIGQKHTFITFTLIFSHILPDWPTFQKEPAIIPCRYCKILCPENIKVLDIGRSGRICEWNWKLEDQNLAESGYLFGNVHTEQFELIDCLLLETNMCECDPLMADHGEHKNETYVLAILLHILNT
jgi:hypothetical protein